MKRILVIVFTLLSMGVYGQSARKNEVGLRVVYGIKNEILPEHTIYKPILILPYYNHYFTRADKRARFSTFFEGQVAPAIIDYQEASGRGGDEDLDWEVGFNIGPALSYRLGWFTPYIGAAYGAEIITVNTSKQRDGYIFAATAFTGIKKEIKNELYGDIHFRLRHISNGGAKYPNKGIDTVLLGAGISKIF
jgi:hypothetical protein